MESKKERLHVSELCITGFTVDIIITTTVIIYPFLFFHSCFFGENSAFLTQNWIQIQGLTYRVPHPKARVIGGEI
jgi:hypothetical protein